MRPSHALGRLSLIPCALRLTSSPDRCQNRGERQGELAGQRRAPRRACPAPQPPPEFLEGARIANPSRAGEGGRSRHSEDGADREARQRPTREPAGREGDVHRGGGDDRDDTRSKLEAEAETVDPTAIRVQPALVDLTPDCRYPNAADAELDHECRAEERP